MHDRPTIPWLYKALREAYGPQDGWWPSASPFEVCVGAILVQNTTWQQVARAIANLKAVGALDPDAIRALPTEAIEDLVRPSGTFRQKARRLEIFSHYIITRWDGDLDMMLAQDGASLRAELLGIWGIGEETADAITLFAAHQPAVIVDAYTTRIARRLGFVAEKETRHDIRRLFTAALPHDANSMRAMHALLVTHAKTHCRATPLCIGCPLADRCDYWKEHVA
ncbi:MAG: endonuclease III domain-containing protein [Chloroflexota bacterium]|nr:endonuclease III domain-containing protein [Chloroflexota bacterium]